MCLAPTNAAVLPRSGPRIVDKTSLIYLSLLTNFYNEFIFCLYMFRAQVLIVRRPKLYYTASGIITPIGVMIPIITPIGVMIPEAV